MSSITTVPASFCRGVTRLVLSPVVNKTAELCASLWEQIGLKSVSRFVRAHPFITTSCLLASVTWIAFKCFPPSNPPLDKKSEGAVEPIKKEEGVTRTKNFDEIVKKYAESANQARDISSRKKRELLCETNEKGELMWEGIRMLLVNRRGDPVDERGESVEPREGEDTLVKLCRGEGISLDLWRNGDWELTNFSIKLSN